MDASTGSSAFLHVVEPAKLRISIRSCNDDMLETPCVLLVGKRYPVTLVLTDHSNNRIHVDEVCSPLHVTTCKHPPTPCFVFCVCFVCFFLFHLFICFSLFSLVLQLQFSLSSTASAHVGLEHSTTNGSYHVAAAAAVGLADLTGEYRGPIDGSKGRKGAALLAAQRSVRVVDPITVTPAQVVIPWSEEVNAPVHVALKVRSSGCVVWGLVWDQVWVWVR